MVVSITVDGIPQVTLMLNNLAKTLGQPVDGIMQAVNEVLLPDVEAKSSSTWNVRTGAYSMGWYQEPISPSAVRVANQMPYSIPLEYGWTTKNGSFVESPGVLFTSVDSVEDDLVASVEEWIANQAGL